MCKVLIIEDDEFYIDHYRKEFRNFDLFMAKTIPEALAQFHANSDFVAIVVDACLGSREPNSLGLIREMRYSFKGPMVAISGSKDFRKQQLAAGCDESCTKDELPELMATLELHLKMQ